MKILFIADTYPPNVNGAALATQRLAEALAAVGHEVTVIAPSPSLRSYSRREEKVAVYRVKSLPILIEKIQEFRVSPKPLHAKQVRKIIQNIRPDIIHVVEPWWLGLSGIKIARQAKIPVILSHHFMPENLVHYLHLPLQVQAMLEQTIWRWYSKVCRNVNLIICPTQSAANLLKKRNPGLPLYVISNGIDLQKFTTSNNGLYLKQKYKLSDTLTLLFVGRLDKEKNIDVLIRALGLLHSSLSFPWRRESNSIHNTAPLDFHLVIVGQGKEEKPLKELAAELGVLDKLTFTGYLPKKDLPNIYKVADIFVMPSIAELQSLVTMEAMASGLPIIGADAVALPHLIHDTENGFLFRPGDERDLAEKLERLLTDKKLREKMGEKSLGIIQEHDMDAVVKKFETVYQEVMNNYKNSHSLSA